MSILLPIFLRISFQLDVYSVAVLCQVLLLRYVSFITTVSSKTLVYCIVYTVYCIVYTVYED